VALRAFVDAYGLPFATMFMDKSVLEEQHPAYIGMYDGRRMDESVWSFVETCDSVLTIGAIMSDFNTDAFTSPLDRRRPSISAIIVRKLDQRSIRMSK